MNQKILAADGISWARRTACSFMLNNLPSKKTLTHGEIMTRKLAEIKSRRQEKRAIVVILN